METQAAIEQAGAQATAEVTVWTNALAEAARREAAEKAVMAMAEPGGSFLPLAMDPNEPSLSELAGRVTLEYRREEIRYAPGNEDTRWTAGVLHVAGPRDAVRAFLDRLEYACKQPRAAGQKQGGGA